MEKSVLLLLGRAFYVLGPGNHITTWKVVNDIKANEVPAYKVFHNEDVGVFGFEFGPIYGTVKDAKGKYPSRINICDLFRHL